MQLSTTSDMLLLQEAVLLDPYARSIIGRRQYGQLAQVSVLHSARTVLFGDVTWHSSFCHQTTADVTSPTLEFCGHSMHQDLSARVQLACV